ncbi:hypothetical protein SprV_0902710000 [Sparganum proliferum]
MSTVCPTAAAAVEAGTVTCAGVYSASRLALHLPTLSPPPPPEPGVKTKSRRPETGEAAGGWLGRILTLAFHSAPPGPHNNDQDFSQHNRDLEAGTAEAAPRRAANAWLGSHTVVWEMP